MGGGPWIPAPEGMDGQIVQGLCKKMNITLDTRADSI